MTLLNFFLSKKKSTADMAKERLQIIVAERKRHECTPDYIPAMKRDVLNVICKYIQIDPKMLTVQFEQKDDDIAVLEFNIIIPESGENT
ncbi:Cell division topological specificity factor [Candidatus Arsenophonus lipoptenae]|uniref:Cell division topological specificity factor n=1 Tax=Candidatus Arsenophonus lipoptenae TaxID=634113 RepID=A0A0X9VF32_9GAMM|nr:cell division topological specificity factor MinE [Candidatus Arsenophonus lipoptenae]AMA65214.1 Cell division topological specificity factor [Candidatus Arsenophonus lipoptenae]